MAGASDRATLGAVEAGALCPACLQGVLVLVGQTADGRVYRCFMCDRSQSVPDEGEHELTTSSERQAPSGMVVTPAQAEAAGAADPEQAAARTQAAPTQPSATTRARSK